MKEINDDNELLKIHKKGKGYVYNDYAGRRGDPKFNVLHESTCYLCNPNHKMGMKAKIPKFYSNNLKEAQTWLRNNRKDRYKRCGHCME